MRVSKTSLLLPLLLLALPACEPEIPRFRDLIGTWRSNADHEVTIDAKGHYRFCDRSNCFSGSYVRPGSEAGFAIELNDFFLHKETERFRLTLESLENEPVTERTDYPRLDFSITHPGVAEEWCEGEPCVFFGSIEPGSHLIFRLDKPV